MAIDRKKLLDSVLSKLQQVKNVGQSAKTNLGDVGRTLGTNLRYVRSEATRPVTRELSNVGRTIVNSPQIIAQNARFLKESPEEFARYSREAMDIKNPYAPAPIKNLGIQLATTFARGVGGAQTLLDPTKTRTERALGGVTAGLTPLLFTPQGVAANYLASVGAGQIERVRQGKGLNLADTSGAARDLLPSEGFGIENPLLALGVDVLAGGATDPTSYRGLTKGGTKSLGNVYAQYNDALRDHISRLEKKVRQLELNNGTKTAIKQTQKAIDEAYKQIAQNRIKARKQGLTMGIVGETAGTPSASKPKLKTNKVVDQIFNTEKFKLSKKNRKTLDSLRKSLGFETRDVRSFDEMRDLAEELGTDPSKLIRDVQNNRITDSEVIALTNVINTSTDRISALTKQLKSDPSNSLLRTKLGQEEQLLSQAIGKRIRGGTEAGRAVVAFRNIARKNMDPAYWLDKAKRQIGGDKDLPTDVVVAINGLIKNKDRLGLARFVSMLGESSTWDKAVGLWKAGLLTSFRTHEANIISNLGAGVMETIKDIPAVGFDIIRSKLTGSPREKAFGIKVLQEMAVGAKRGIGVAKNILAEGVDPRDVDKLDIYKPLRFGNTIGGRFAQAYTNVIFRGLGAGDKIFYETAYGRSLAEQSLLETINKNLSAEEASKLLANPTEDMITRAVAAAEEATFTKKNVLADVIQGAKNRATGPTRAGVELLAPFVKTPANVAEAIFNYTPAGFLKDAVKKVLKGESVSNQRLAESFGRSATGMGLLWAGSQLADIIQGPSPASESERSQMYLEGRQPNSILVNGKWVRVDKISPLGNLLILGAEYKKSGGDLMSTAFTGVKSLTEQTFLKGVSSGLQAVNDPSNYAGSFVENTAGGVIPTIISDVGRGTDDFMREAEGPFERIQSRIPAVREGLPERLDALGEPIAQEEGILGAMFDPFNASPATNDPLIQEFSRVGYSLNTVGDSIGGVKLTSAQQREFQRVAGAKIKEIVPQVISSSAYQSATDDQKKSLITSAVNKAKDIAREDVKRRLDEITDDKGFKSKAAELSPNYGYEVSTDAPSTLMGKIGLYGQSLITNPFETVGAMANGNPIRKMRGDITVLERKKGLGQIDQGNRDTVIDHKIPLSLGGSNKPENLQQLSTTENQQKAKVEVHLIDLVESGEITKKEAQERVGNWREELKNLGSEFPIATQDDIVIKGDYSYIDDKGTYKTLNLSKIASMPEDTEYNSLLKKREAYKLVDDIIKNLDPQQQESALKELGISREDAEYYDLANQDTLAKSVFIRELASGLPSDNRVEFLGELAQLRKEILGKQALTNSVIDDLVEDGLISKDEGKVLKGFKFDETGKPKLKMTGRGKSAKLKKITPVKIDFSPRGIRRAPTLNPKIPEMSIPILPVAKLRTSTVEAPKFRVKFNL